MTPEAAFKYYGDPLKTSTQKKWMENYTPRPVWRLPVRKIWMNKEFTPVFEVWMQELFETGLIREIKTFDGCHNVRKQRHAEKWSMHSWAVAVDFNMKQNPMFNSQFQCKQAGLIPFTDGFLDISRLFVDCGYDFDTLDGMHFQLK